MALSSEGTLFFSLEKKKTDRNKTRKLSRLFFFLVKVCREKQWCNLVCLPETWHCKMDEEMEEPIVGEGFEIDFIYEFDAPQYYDFTKPETLVEGRDAELWFESATSYPPSRKHFN